LNQILLDIVQLRERFSDTHELARMSDGAIIFVRHWLPSSSVSDAAVLILHGITAYSGPYGKLIASAIAAAGFHVYGIDMRGHGLSDGKRGDYPSAERLASDLCETTEFVSQRASKVVVLGHSLGVLSAGILARNCIDKIDGLVLLSAGKRINPGVYKKPSSRTMIRNLSAATLFKSRTMIEYNRAGMSGLDDPLFNFRYSARFLFFMYGANASSLAKMMSTGELNTPNLIFPELQIPLWMGVGANDELFSEASARTFFDNINCKDKEFYVIQGASHASFPEGSFEPLIAWLKQKFVSGERANRAMSN